jgi:broad specificity phosphatase PhoE
MSWAAAIGASVAVTSKVYNDYQAKKNRPKYNIPTEATENKALAQQSAFGQNPAIAQGNALADQSAAEDINTAQQYSSSTGNILNTLKAINANKNLAKRNLSVTDAEMRSNARNNLIGVNKDTIDELDKAWNYNVNEPYQNQVASNREFAKSMNESFWKILDSNRAQSSLKSGG